MRRAAWGVILAGGLGLVFVSGRSWAYARRGARLVAVARAFPESYAVAKGDGALLVLGDSTALGVGVAGPSETLGALVAPSLRLGRVVDLGVSGATTRDVVQGQIPRLPEGPLPVALVSITANDATRGTPPSDVEDGLTALFEALERRGVGRVVVTTTPNFVGVPALPWPLSRVVAGRARALAETVRKVAARYPFVRVADLNALGTLAGDEYAADGFHPNARGYARWAKIVLEAAVRRPRP